MKRFWLFIVGLCFCITLCADGKKPIPHDTGIQYHLEQVEELCTPLMELAQQVEKSLKKLEGEGVDEDFQNQLKQLTEQSTQLMNSAEQCEEYASYASSEAQVRDCEDADVSAYNIELLFFEAKIEFKKVNRALEKLEDSQSSYGIRTSLDKALLCLKNGMWDLLMATEGLESAFEDAEACL